MACMTFKTGNVRDGSVPSLSDEKNRYKHKEKELQMQTLYVIGTLTERTAPPAYFNFDGFDGSCLLHIDIKI